MTTPARVGFHGRRILVAEDEYMIADEIVTELAAAGAEVVGPAPTVAAALSLVEAAGSLDAAVLDVNLNGEMIWPVLDALTARGVPILLATGYDAGVAPAAHAHLPRCEKPVDARDLLRALAKRLAASG